MVMDEFTVSQVWSDEGSDYITFLAHKSKDGYQQIVFDVDKDVIRQVILYVLGNYDDEV